MQDSVKQSMDYVRGLATECVMDHGYRCVEVEEDDFLKPDSDRRMVPGLYLRAWQAAYQDFRAIPDLTDEQKDLKHYKFGFTQSETHFIVLFQGLLLPQIEEGEPVGTMRAVFGRSVKYWVDKKSLRVSKRLFMR